MWKTAYIVLKVLITALLIVSLTYNLQYCSDIHKYKQLVEDKNNTISKKDSLIETRLTNDSLSVSEFLVQNSPDISMPILLNKIDSLKKEDKIKQTDIGKSGGYYNKTKFEAVLVNAKATKSNDTIAEYVDKNWNINYNKSSDIFNAKYYGELETVMGNRSTVYLGSTGFGKENLTAYKWFDNANTKVVESETIYVPEPKKNSDFKLYTNTEYRQGFNSVDEARSLTTDKTSVYQGIGASYQYKRHGVGIEGNYRVLGDDILPKSEIKLKYNFFIIK